MNADTDEEQPELERLAEAIAEAIRIGEMRTGKTKDLLLKFAEEIKRQAIEP